MSEIKRLREIEGFTQESLARAAGVSVSTVQNWEQGRAGQEMFETVAQLCDLLRCGPRDLIEKKGELQNDGNQ